MKSTKENCLKIVKAMVKDSENAFRCYLECETKYTMDLTKAERRKLLTLKIIEGILEDDTFFNGMYSLYVKE